MLIIVFFPRLIYLYTVAVLGPVGVLWLFSGFGAWGLLGAAASLVEHKLGSACTSVVVALGLGCSKAGGIILDQVSNPCPLHWQVDF